MKSLFLKPCFSLLYLFLSFNLVFCQEIKTFFSPHGGCENAIKAELDSALSSVYVSAYQLTNWTLCTALIDAKKRGVVVRIIVDRSQTSGNANQPSRVKASGADIRVDRIEKIFHNKYAIVDHSTVITGSYNWSDNAELRNAENLLIIRNLKTSASFEADFTKHWEHSNAFIWKATSKFSSPNSRAVSFFHLNHSFF